MDDVRIGRQVRALRIRAPLTQRELAEAAGVPRSLISQIENGSLTGVDLRRLEAICRALGAEADLRLRWRGEGLDRLLDAAHAAIVEQHVGRLDRWGWINDVEMSFNVYGEKGSIDVFSHHPTAEAVLVSEIKSVIADAQGTLRPLDMKTRHARKLAVARGVKVRSVSRVLVVGDRSTNRRRVLLLEATFRSAFPERGREVTRFLRSPEPGRSISGLLFLPDVPLSDIGRAAAGRLRVVRPRGRSEASRLSPSATSGSETGAWEPRG
jgi:transcriptional regulator with XRE-family HTH domain